MARWIGSAVVLMVVAAGSYELGQRHASRESADVRTLAHALERTALCANGLNMLAEGRQDGAARLLADQLRSAVRSVQEHKRAAADIRVEIPSLLDGLRRAKLYAERIGDVRLAQELSVLHKELQAGKAKPGA